MDLKSIDFDWNRAKAFYVTAKQGSFSAAAKTLKLTQSTLGRQVSAFEQELGVVLFERGSRGVEITPAGLELFEYVKAMGDSASKLSMSAMGKSEQLEGTVTITASEINSAFILPPILKKIREIAPKIKIEIVAKNESSDLRKREADIAVRNFRPNQNDLIMKKVPDSLGNFYATKSYIKHHGPFESLSDLSKAEFVNIGNLTDYIEGLKGFGLHLTQENFPYITGSHYVHWGLVKQGVAIGIMPHAVGDKDKDVQRVVKTLEGIPYSTWIVSHRELHTNRKIRFVFDMLVEYFENL